VRRQNRQQVVMQWDQCLELIQVQPYSSSHKRFDSVFIRSLSAGLTPPVECERDNCLSTDNYRGLAILNVCILILIMTTTEVTVGLVSR